jgi:hypothetical protein
LVDRYGIFVSQMTTDMFWWTQVLRKDKQFLLH